MTNHDDDNEPAAQPPPLPLPPLPGGPAGGYGVPYWPVPGMSIGPPQPRVWTALWVPVITIIAALIAATAAIVIAAAIHLGPAEMQNQDNLMAWIASYGATPEGFLVLVLPGQCVFLASALIAGALSPVPLIQRLGLGRPRGSLWIVPLLAAATPFAALCGDLLLWLLFGDYDPPDHIKFLNDLFRGAGGPFLVLATLAISVLPGFSEEMLFRGYSQRRLLERWRPAAVIAFTSVLFAAAHMNLVHAVAVLPVGIWLGVIAWLCGSIWPAIICHATNNALASLLVSAGVAEVGEPFHFDTASLTLMSVTGTLAAVSVWVMWKYRA